MTENIWHTQGDYDPWGWRMRVAEQGKHAYGRFFHGHAGFVSQAFLADFAVVRRQGRDAYTLYEDGVLTPAAMRIYDCLCAQDSFSYPALKVACGMGQGKSPPFEKALRELEGLFLICICGQTHKVSQKGVPYGWPSNDFARMDARFAQAFCAEPPFAEAYARISQAVLRQGEFDARRVHRFITG